MCERSGGLAGAGATLLHHHLPDNRQYKAAAQGPRYPLGLSAPPHLPAQNSRFRDLEISGPARLGWIVSVRGWQSLQVPREKFPAPTPFHFYGYLSCAPETPFPHGIVRECPSFWERRVGLGVAAKESTEWQASPEGAPSPAKS